jgi:hypothetical protein
MSNQIFNKQFSNLDMRYWHIEGTPLFADMERHM